MEKKKKKRKKKQGLLLESIVTTYMYDVINMNFHASILCDAGPC